MNKIIEIWNLKKSFDNGKIKALNGVDLEIVRGNLSPLWGLPALVSLHF